MRIDLYLSQKGFCESRNKASRLIDAGLVTLDGRTVQKPSEEIDETAEHNVEIKKDNDFVGRGGLKLDAAIGHFALDVSGKRCIDVGASTGGFTQCLLMRGAQSVVAVDSGKGQLHKSLLDDPRVKSVEGYNARNLNVSEFGMFDIAVMDVSFISQTLIIPALSQLICDGGVLVSLIKPQFEAGRQAIGKNGIVKKASDREYSLLRVSECAGQLGLELVDVIKSPITGGDGNIEYLACFAKRNEVCGVSAKNITRINRLCRE